MNPMSTVDRLSADFPGGWRARIHRYSSRLYGPDPATTCLTWIADERIAIGTMPTGATIGRLAAEGVTHVVNCRAIVETLLSQDLAVERARLGQGARGPCADVGHRGGASIRDGGPTRPASWCACSMRTPRRAFSSTAWVAAIVLSSLPMQPFGCAVTRRMAQPA